VQPIWSFLHRGHHVELSFGNLNCTVKRAVMGKESFVIAYDIYHDELGRWARVRKL
jgi:hypothetical protein